MGATGPWKIEAQPLSIGPSSRSIKNSATQCLFTAEMEVSQYPLPPPGFDENKESHKQEVGKNKQKNKLSQLPW